MEQNNRREFLIKAMNSTKFSFLPAKHPLESVALASYPRSGNTMMRNYLEKLTRIYTGADTMSPHELVGVKKQETESVSSASQSKDSSETPNKEVEIVSTSESEQSNNTNSEDTFATQGFFKSMMNFPWKNLKKLNQGGKKMRMDFCYFFKENGLIGEGLVGKETWITKTHYPYVKGARAYQVQKAVLIVRNPFDALYSYVNMVVTKSHNQTMKDEEFAQIRALWKQTIPFFIEDYKNFHEFWLNSDIPVYLMRFEDLVENPKEELKNLSKFLWEVDDISEIGLEERIANITEVKDAANLNAGSFPLVFNLF